MIKLMIDSAADIGRDEAAAKGIIMVPMLITIGEEEFYDGVDLSAQRFWEKMVESDVLPKTSLINDFRWEEAFAEHTKGGDELIVITISSKLSGTYNAMQTLFKNNERVRVIDSKTAVGGMKILVREANKYLNESLDYVESKLNALIPRIKVLAVPETLDYLHKGGRLSKAAWAVGTILKIKPIIELKHTVKVGGKTIGLKSAMKFILAALENCDTAYPIVPSYTYDTENLEELISKTKEEYQAVMTEKDNIDPAVAAHWGPHAFGYIFVEKE